MAAQLTAVCDKAVTAPSDGGTRDWVESLVTCAVIVFAIRAYFIQPFKIPTGSMQPTLNGIIPNPISADTPKPNVLRQAWELAARGRNYVRVEAPCDGHLTKIEQKSFGLFVTTSTLSFTDAAGSVHTTTAWTPTGQLLGRPILRPDNRFAETVGSGSIASRSTAVISESSTSPALSSRGRHPCQKRRSARRWIGRFG